jgi:hypothetical protein
MDGWVGKRGGLFPSLDDLKIALAFRVTAIAVNLDGIACALA